MVTAAMKLKDAYSLDPIFPSGCEGKLGVALESLQGGLESNPASSLQTVPTQESNQGLLHCRQLLYQLSYQGSKHV